MLVRAALGLAFLLALFPLWGWLGRPGAHPLDGWLVAAYAIVFAVLGAYRAHLADRSRRALAETAELACRASPATTAGLPARGRVAGALEQLAVPLLAVMLLLATLYAPEEKTMGMVQRIFYVHVPAAWCAFLAFGVVALASIGYLATRRPGPDRVARASAEVGVVFTTLVLVTGPVWAKPVWGIWWTWDARLTLTLVLWLVYLGYLMLRAYVADPDRSATLGAVLGILGFVGVPINYMAIRWWRTQHPQPVIAGGEGSGLDPFMLRAFLFGLLTMTVVYLALLLQRVEVARLEDENEERHRRLG